MNKILLMALVLGTLSTTNVLAATDMATTISSTNSTTATSEVKTHQTEAYGMQSVTAMPKIYGDGEKIVAIIIKYPEAIQESALALNTFTVEGKTINNIYTNSVPELKENYKSTAKGLHNGTPQIDTTVGQTNTVKASKKDKNSKATAADQYVVVEFEYENSTPFVLAQRPNKPKNNGAVGVDAPLRSDRKLPNLNVTVTQVQPVVTKTGTIYGPSQTSVINTSTASTIMDEFKTYIYTDPTTGNSIPYNVFYQKTMMHQNNILYISS